MGKDRIDPARKRFPALSGRFIVDVYRGKERVRTWPRKRGKNLPAITRVNNAVFAERNRLAKYAASQQIIAAMEATKGTGLYPRDLLMRAMATGLYDIPDPDVIMIRGTRPWIEEKMFNGVILELSANTAIQLSAWRTVNWPTPVLDTAGYFNPAAPTLITIPAGVQVIQINIKAINVAGGTQTLAMRVKDQNGVDRANAQNRTLGGPGLSANSGALIVAAGDTFQPQFFITAGGFLAGAGRTALTVEMLQGS